MKKIIFVFIGMAGILISVLPLNAQEGTTEVSAKYGVVTVQEIGVAFGAALGDAIASGLGATVTSDEIDATGAISVGAQHYVSDRFSVGAGYTFEQFERTYSYSSGASTTTQTTFHIPMAGGTFRYINNDNFQLYGSALAGAYFSNEKENGGPAEDQVNGFAFQVSPIGARFGKGFGVHIELGLGFQGLAIGGLSGQF